MQSRYYLLTYFPVGLDFTFFLPGLSSWAMKLLQIVLVLALFCPVSGLATGVNAKIEILKSNLRKGTGMPPGDLPHGREWWTWDRTISEVNGEVGVTITESQHCFTYLSGSDCTEKQTWKPPQHLKPRGSWTMQSWFYFGRRATKGAQYEMEIFGTDDNGNPVSASIKFVVKPPN